MEDVGAGAGAGLVPFEPEPPVEPVLPPEPEPPEPEPLEPELPLDVEFCAAEPEPELVEPDSFEPVP
jgi:hypothetical protein